MTHRRIADQWETYCLAVYGVASSKLPATQGQECRRCFYAGARGLLTLILQGLDPGDEPTEADLIRMDALHAELEAFAQAVAQGSA